MIKHVELKPFVWLHSSASPPNRCDLDLFFIQDRVMVIATEREDDPDSGMSISNGAEILATIIKQKYRLPPEAITWVEHFPEKEIDQKKVYHLGETYSRVRFAYRGNRFIAPTWERIDSLGAKAFIQALSGDYGVI